MAKFSSFTQLLKEFVREHTKSRLKHDVLSQIHQFKQELDEFLREHTKSGLKNDVLSHIHHFTQEPNKMVRGYANCLRQYLTRCPVMEIPSQEWLVSLFLEGLWNKELHSANI